MAEINYTKQTWDTRSYVNPTRMNHIEDGISGAYDVASEISGNLSLVEEKVDGIGDNMLVKSDEEGIPSSVPRDADTLGGHPADYFASNSALVELENAKVKYKDIALDNISIASRYGNMYYTYYTLTSRGVPAGTVKLSATIVNYSGLNSPIMFTFNDTQLMIFSATSLTIPSLTVRIAYI